MGVGMEALVIMTRGSATVEELMLHTIITVNTLDPPRVVSKHGKTHVHQCNVDNNVIHIEYWNVRNVTGVVIQYNLEFYNFIILIIYGMVWYGMVIFYLTY